MVKFIQEGEPSDFSYVQVSSKEGKENALILAAASGFVWVSSSKIPCTGGFVPGVYQMRFKERINQND